MKVEKLSKRKSKRIILVITIIVLLVGIIYITNSKAKYQITKSVQIVNGNVNYSLADLNVLALQVQDSKGSETYNQVETVPIGNYKVNVDKSYCKYPGDNLEHKDIPMEYKNNRVSISINKKGTKCYIYLDVASTKKVETALGTIDVNLYIPDFNKTSCEDGCEEATNGIYEGEENGLPTYYFRGTVDNNYVLFANMYWRIIRINSNGSIRIIYNGSTPGATGKATQLNNGEAQTFSKDAKNDDNAYVGYMYGETSQAQSLDGYNATHANTHDSGIKEYIDNWYKNVLSKAKNNEKNATEYIDIEAGFCGDRTPFQFDGISVTTKPDKNEYGAGTTPTYYGAWYRRDRSHQLTFDCPNVSNDLYTVSGAKTGNHALTNPIGLITADEVMYAGGQHKINSEYWLYTGEAGYWTMSSSSFNKNPALATILHVSSDGTLGGDYVSTKRGVRPVINLKANTKFTGSGTTDSPFVVQ